MGVLAFDTSNYTTSVAYLATDSNGISSSLTRLLTVPKGELGLRQQEALFQHTKALPSLMEELQAQGVALSQITAIAVSTRPREVDGSYMPCFLAGESMARSLAIVLQVPCYFVSHQQGHMAAALWSIDKTEYLEKPFLAWHLSGGTTELLYVQPKGVLVESTLLGGTQDISVGQLIDRTGQRLQLAFPSGKEVDAFAMSAVSKEEIKPYMVKEKEYVFSLSGMENKVEQFLREGASPSSVCAFVLDTVAKVILKVTKKAQQEYGIKNTGQEEQKQQEALPVVFCGGVASSQRLRLHLEKEEHYFFSQPRYATDNAMGVAVLGQRLQQESRIKREVRGSSAT